MQITKQERLLAIKEVIANKRISSQEDLKLALAENGIEISQATLSRDLQEIGVIKGHGGSSYYALPTTHYGVKEEDFNIHSFEISGNIAILKTMPGHANMFASLIDRKELPEFAGTVAGDDTILIVLRKNVTEIEAYQSLSSILTINY